MQIDLGTQYKIDGFSYQSREGGSVNAAIAKYAFYVSKNGKNWGKPVAIGTFAKSIGIGQKVDFKLVNGRYIRLVALSEVNGNNYTNIGELFVYKSDK